MTIKVRLLGEPDEINAMVVHLQEEFEVAGGERSYPNRGDFGVRVYLAVRTRAAATSKSAQRERVQDEAKEVDP
ncbi:hypothetical protein [Kribbella lupini]|uniref:Uncharacterized protein n=1 Tax=Kribbella lupini TaxID=291602 RepID=A0ABP4LTC3_9ACTN